ncbi:MAG: transcription-repair coupling factor [Bifidobacteriaceae bacterium]|nr:transcription-repair coupling factor [Bifidobacteriaceae bacterium]
MAADTARFQASGKPGKPASTPRKASSSQAVSASQVAGASHSVKTSQNAASPQAPAPSQPAADAPHAPVASGTPRDGSLSELLPLLGGDTAFAELLDDAQGPADDEPLVVDAPHGVRPAVAAAVAARRPVVLVVPSDRDAEEIAGSLRSWYAGSARDIAVLPAWETLPHERLSPRADTVAQRMAVFHRLAHPRPDDPLFSPIRLLVMPIRSLIQPIVGGIEDVEPLVFKTGEQIPFDEAERRLVENAYTRVDLVMDRGDFAVRGGIIDVFPPTAPHPVRIEFFGDEIDTIREFHASDQRTFGDDVPIVWATPCRELQFTEDVRTRAKSLVGVIANADDMLESIANAIPVEGMESLLPALVDDLRPVWNLFDGGSVAMLWDPERLNRAADDLSRTSAEFLAASWHVAAEGRGAGAPISFDAASFYPYDTTVRSLLERGLRVWEFSDFGTNSAPVEGDAGAPAERAVPERAAEAASADADGARAAGAAGDAAAASDARSRVAAWGHVTLGAQASEEYRGREDRIVSGVRDLVDARMRVVITAPSHGTLSRLRRAMNEALVPGVDYVQSRAIDGFIDPPAGLALLTERDITGRNSAAGLQRTPQRRRKTIDLLELKPGDFVVHEQHGIGRFVGMQKRKVAGDPQAEREYIVIEYAPSHRGAPADRLFVPADQLDQISKYIGSDQPKLNKLGGADWEATKSRARKHVKEIADDLVRLYSARQATPGFAFSPDTPWQRELEDAFPYQETPDQLRTIDEVKADMEKPVPMDRLICGDVGFGKTEIAVRAAFKAVQDGKQVAVLAPTTLLVQQHYETFTQRYEGFPVDVEQMSRFQTAKEIAETTEGLASGKVDVVIGTHKLLNPSIKFKDLGLVIIDEEQRFGVEHKETLKALRTNVDVLSLSATPIPRTLEMAVTGIREMSTLATPPEDRLPVLTYVGRYEDSQVAAAIKRELLRGGQVFYVHNRVQDISKVAAHLAELVPDAHIAVAHGKMSEKQLDSVIRDFWHRDIDVLVCTTIIETGLDISNANTLIVDRADRFGLSQLHQLRGRVGRGRERAYAYFLYDPERPMTQTAHDRLLTIAQNTALGAGFDVAMKDLEIRGTGNLLGGEQSGHIEGVGFDLYVRMVSDAVEHYKEPDKVEEATVAIDLPIEASIPADYIAADKLRLQAYREIAEARTEDDFREIREELRDRYGALPESLDSLFAVASLRNRARGMGITDIIAQGRSVRVVGFDPPESVLMRMIRVYHGTQYRPVTHTLVIPAPFQGSLGSKPMTTPEVLAWVDQMLDDLTWSPKPRP